jgi:electron transport complex protein RnfG
MKEMLGLGLKLFIITAVSALVLGFTNSITAPVIAENERIMNEETRKEMLEVADKFEKVDVDKENILEVYKGLKDNEVVGYVIKTATKGYGGDVVVMIGIDSEGIIKRAKVVKHAETPGLGANAKNPEFIDQYSEKNVKMNIEVVKNNPTDEQIQAITGATITSKAVTKGINAAVNLFNNELNQ